MPNYKEIKKQKAHCKEAWKIQNNLLLIMLKIPNICQYLINILWKGEQALFAVGWKNF